MYPAIIAAHIILDVPLSTVTAVFLPMTVLAGLAGLVSATFVLRSKKPPPASKGRAGKILLTLLVSAWPILLIVALVLSGVEAWIAFPAVLVLVMAQQKVRWNELKASLRYGLEPKIIVLLIAVMFFKAVIETSGAAGTLIADMDALRLPAVFVIAFLPFLIGLAAGLSMAFVGITFPLLAPLIALGGNIDYAAMLLAYVSGIVGMLVSPLHLCFLLSSEYFQARLLDVYRYVIPPVAAIEIIALDAYLVLHY
jgi:integral membrane protein (TIGR00529 family)